MSFTPATGATPYIRTPCVGQHMHPSRFRFRVRKPPIQRNLKKEIQRKKNPIVRIEAPFGIVGFPGSGRKTLAYRLAHMNCGVIQDNQVPPAYFYTITLGGRFEKEFKVLPNGRFVLRLTAYIIEPPAELPAHNPPLYMEHFNNFCCLVFAFDSRSRASFHEVYLRLYEYRNSRTIRLPTCYVMVSTKIDARDEPFPEEPEYQNQRPIPFFDAHMESQNLGMNILPCSAKCNIGVDGLLRFIWICAMDRKYFILDN